MGMSLRGKPRWVVFVICSKLLTSMFGVDGGGEAV